MLLVLVFVSGALSGFFVGRGQTIRHKGEDPTREEILDRWEYECQLDPEQKSAFDRIFREYHPRFATVKKTIEPELAIIRSEVHDKLRTTLQGEQGPRFEAYWNERSRQRDAKLR